MFIYQAVGKQQSPEGANRRKQGSLYVRPEKLAKAKRILVETGEVFTGHHSGKMLSRSLDSIKHS